MGDAKRRKLAGLLIEKTRAEKLWDKHRPRWAENPYDILCRYWETEATRFRNSYLDAMAKHPNSLLVLDDHPQDGAKAMYLPYSAVSEMPFGLDPAFIQECLQFWECRVWKIEELDALACPPSGIVLWHTGGADSDFISGGRIIYRPSIDAPITTKLTPIDAFPSRQT